MSMNNEDRYPSSSIDVIQNKIFQENNKINQFLSEREIQLNKGKLIMNQSKTSIYENNIHSNLPYINGLKYNLNLISSGIVIINQSKKLVYSNKQSIKIIKQKKNSIILDELTEILSLQLQNSKNTYQQSQKYEASQQPINNQNKQIQSQRISAKLDLILQESILNSENEKDKISKEDQQFELHQNIVYNQQQICNHNSNIQCLNQFSECQCKNFNNNKISQLISKDKKSDQLSKYNNNQILEKYKYSVQIRDNNQIQNDDESKQARNFFSSNQNINLYQIKSENLSFKNINNVKNQMNKSEKLLVLPTQSCFCFEEQLSDQIIQCHLPYNLNQIFTQNNLKIDDIINFLIKFSVSPNCQEKNIDKQIKLEDDNERNNSNSSKLQKNNQGKENNFTQINYSGSKKQNPYLSISIEQNSNNNNNQIDKHRTGNNVNDMKVKLLINDEEKTKILKKQQNQEIKNTYNYFIQNNYLHLILNLEGDQLKTQENKIVEIKLSVLINIKSDHQQKFIQFEISDITQLKKQVDKEHLETYKNKVLSSISHELRTPLNCSISMLDMLTQHEEIPVFLKQVFVIPALNSNYLLLNIINDIIDLAQINYGNFSMQFSQFELNKIFTECINLISMQALQKKLEIELDLDSSIPQIINSDQNRIRQVLLNLLSNALKFTQQGKITIRASQKEESLIQIDIEDTGCGIPEKNLMMIMKRFGKKDIYNFEDLKNNSYLNTMGVGLGLTIANNLAAGLGGNRKLQVSSIENIGTKFQFYIVNHPHNKIGCNIEENRIFGKELFKWKTISETSSNQQQQYQQLQQSAQFQHNILKEKSNNQQNLNKLVRSQSMINLKINDTKQAEESISPLIENKFTKPLQSLYKFNTEVFQNQNAIQTHQNINSFYNQIQEPNSIISQTQNLTEGGKQKKYNLSFAEQTNYSFQESQIIKQQNQSQYYSSIKTKSIYEKNNQNCQIFQDYFSSDDEGSSKTINKMTSYQRNFDKDSQIIQEQQILQLSLQDEVNQNKNLDLDKNSLLTSIEQNNQNSQNHFPNIKAKVKIPDKPNSDVQSNIILQETKERQCEIINSNEVLNIQLPNQLKFQKVSQKRQIKN